MRVHRDYSEKRKFIRMKINTPAKVNIEQQGAETFGVCNDLSGSGMLLTVTQPLPVTSELLVTLSPEQSQFSTLRARCTVVRSEQAAGDQCLLGLEIQEILEETTTETA